MRGLHEVGGVLYESGMLLAETTVSQDEVRLSAARPLRVQSVRVARTVPPHDHVFYELCVVVEGRARHRTDAGVEALEAGSVIVVPVGAVHAIERPEALRVVNCYYLAEWLASDLRELWTQRGLVDRFYAAHLFRAPEFRRPRVWRAEAAIFERIRRSLEDIASELGREQPLPVYLRALFISLLVEIARSAPEGEASPGGATDADAPRAFRREVVFALDEVEACLRERRPFGVAEAARRAGLSADRFSRVFAEATGWSPGDYYQRRRVQRACGLLLDPRQTQADVVFALGYSDAAHFHRYFRRIMGETPGAYRKRFFAAGA